MAPTKSYSLGETKYTLGPSNFVAVLLFQKSLTFFFFIDPNLAFERLDIEFRLNGGYIRRTYFDHDEMDGRRRRPDGTFSYWAASTLRHDVGTTYDLRIFSALCGSVGNSLLMTATIT